MKYLLAIDQGTTSTRSILFDKTGKQIAISQRENTQHYPDDGRVEHDPEELWNNVLTTTREAMARSKAPMTDIASIGISNQRETVVMWDKMTGKVLSNAIVWQDRRTTTECEKLVSNGLMETIQNKTGLLIDPYFSATKISWMLENIPESKRLANKNQLACGTVDAFLLWRLTGGKSFYTDATNASRTMLYNINTQCWDDELLQILHIPKHILPEVLDSSADFGVTDKTWFGIELPINGMAGDQQAATIGQACFQPGMIKSTYGTGCFMLLNTGDHIVKSKNRLISTIAYQLNGKVTYGLEGSIFVAGAAVQWLKECFQMFEHADETQAMASSIEDTAGVYLVPAFTGLGAPYWDPDARGALLGLTRDTHVAHIARAALEASSYQSRDLIEAMQDDILAQVNTLRVDGGMAKNDWSMQFLSDILDQPVTRPRCIETSAYGAALLAGLSSGVYSSTDEIANAWQAESVFTPAMTESKRKALYKGWKKAVGCIHQK